MGRKKTVAEPQRDNLGFTFDDYWEMFQQQAAKGLQGDTLLDGYDITPEQVQAINEGDKFAIDMFFCINDQRIRRLAYYFIKKMGLTVAKQFKPMITVDDLVNQAYLDTRRGFLHFEYKTKIISRLLCHSFYYEPVGGFGEEDGEYKVKNRWRLHS